jgi:hypothetical protein
MLHVFGSGAQGYVALALAVGAGAAALVWLVSRLLINPQSEDEGDEGGGPGGGGGGARGGGGGPGRGGLESDPRPDPPESEPAWWPEFERRFADYASSGAQPPPVAPRRDGRAGD